MCFGWRRDLKRKVSKVKVAPNILHRLRLSAQSLFATESTATMLATLTRGLGSGRATMGY